MVQEALNGMLAILLANWVLNDLPHAAGLLANPGYEEPPTPRQLRYIAILCQKLKITVVYEEQVKTVGEAGRMIRELEAEEKHRKQLGSSNPSTALSLFDWSTFSGKPPAITGYVTHNTSPENALGILRDGYIKPFIGSVSFSLDPCFTVADPGVSFIFPESVIREKYGGKEPEYLMHYEPEAVRRIWETEMEVEVKNQLVYISDCVEILPGRDTCWKYCYGYKYHYVDVRDRDYWPWKEFKR